MFDAAACGYDAVMRPVEAAYLGKIRRGFFARAGGRILELGVGTANNLIAYPAGSHVVGVDESVAMLAGARGKTSAPLARMDASLLGFADASFDAVTGSLVFCSIVDPLAALAEVRRVLRPGGRLLLLEHVRGAHPAMAGLTDALDGPWYAMNGSCHLNRETEKLVAEAGFQVIETHRRLAGLLQTIEAVPRRTEGHGATENTEGPLQRVVGAQPHWARDGDTATKTESGTQGPAALPATPISQYNSG